MVIEVLGSRVVGPFFGVSLFVWTSLISVTLLALAAGYALGGLVADRRPSADNLYWIIFAAGVLCLLIPVAKGPVLKACVPLGLRGGAFVSTLLLFGPVLFLLGCVSPYLVRIATRSMRNIGRTVGGLYALSTAGSVAGTVLTGFVLIAYVGVDRIFQLVGTALLVLVVAYFVFYRRRIWVTAAALMPLLVPQPAAFTATAMDNGTRVSLIEARDSYYGSVKILEYSFGRRRNREMIIDGLVQGGIDTRSGLSVYAYTYLLQFVPRLLHPQGGRCLVLGLGAGIVPRWYQENGITTRVIDIDPTVVELARRYFQVPPQVDVAIADARDALTRDPTRYDYIILDVFNGDTTPGHLLSFETLELSRQRLTANGVLAINFVGSIKQRPFITNSVLHTLGRVFDQVEIFPAFDLTLASGGGNMVLVAYDGDRRPVPAVARPVHPDARDVVFAAFRQRTSAPRERQPFVLLTDDYNPIDVYDAWLRESVREHILKNTPWDALLANGR